MGVLHTMAQELPAAVPRMLQWASKNACDVRVMSDCNSVVISHILKGAGPHACTLQPSWCRAARQPSHKQVRALHCAQADLAGI